MHQVLVVAGGLLSCGMRTLSCSMWDLITRPGIKAMPPAVEVWSLNHWTARALMTHHFVLADLDCVNCQ